MSETQLLSTPSRTSKDSLTDEDNLVPSKELQVKSVAEVSVSHHSETDTKELKQTPIPDPAPLASANTDPTSSKLDDTNLVFLSRSFRECQCPMAEPQRNTPKRHKHDFQADADPDLAAPLKMDNSASAASKPSFYRYLSEAKKRWAQSDRNPDQVIYERKDLPVDQLLASKRKQRRKQYKTSIEKWRPGKSKITCPQCGATKTPTIRIQSDRVI